MCLIFSCKKEALLRFCPLKIGIEVSTKFLIAIDTDIQSPGIGSIDSWYRYRPPLTGTHFNDDSKSILS